MFPAGGENGQQAKPRAFVFPEQVFFLVLNYLYKKEKKDANHFLIFSWDTKPVTLSKVYRDSNHAQHGGIRVNTRGIKDNNSVLENSIAS